MSEGSVSASSVSKKKVGFISLRDLLVLAMIGVIGYGAYSLLEGGFNSDPWGVNVLKSTLVGHVDTWMVPRIDSVTLEQLSAQPVSLRSLGSLRSFAFSGAEPLYITRASCVSILYVRREDKRSWTNSGPSPSQKIGSSGGIFVNTVDVGKNPFGHTFYVYVLFVRAEKWNKVKDKSDPTKIVAGGSTWTGSVVWG